MAILLETKELTKVFGGVVANKGVNIQIQEGSITALIGPNGSGKTTFINLVSGVIKPTSGKLFFDGKDITALEAHKISRLGIGRTFQKINLFNRLSVVENVLVARRKFYSANLIDIFLYSKKLKREEVCQFEYSMELLKLVGLDREAFLLPTALPYGKRRALEIARALAIEPRLLLLDEPAAGMSKEEFEGVLKIMRALKEKGITMLLVEHTMEFVRGASDWVFVLNFGEVISQGTFEEIERDPAVIAAYLGRGETDELALD